MLTKEEKYILRILFKNKIFEANGQAFEDIFTSIMNYKEPGFVSIKPWGNIGDRKNDGYIPDRSIFFQVFAPEEIKKVTQKLFQNSKKTFQDWYSSGINQLKSFTLL